MTDAIATYWALLGKPPGTKNDYAVLHSGAYRPDSGQDRTERIWASNPSTPQLGSAFGPGGLPWVTFTPYTEGKRTRMAVTVTDPTTTTDAVGRPSVAVRYIELPFGAVARQRTGYWALRQAVPAFAAMRGHAPDMPLRLELHPYDETAMPGLSRVGGFDRAAGLAALLLCGEVLITLDERDDLSPPDRLAAFDGVLALLPFGLRATISLATWHDIPQTAAFRLAFGQLAARGQQLVPFRGLVPPPKAGAAVGYLEELHAAREEFGLARLIEHLSGYRRPLGADDPTEAYAILSELRQPSLVADTVRAGKRLPVERVVQVRRHATGRLAPDAADDLEGYLMTLGTDEAEREVHIGWSERSRSLAIALALGALEMSDEDQARRLLGYALEHDTRDIVLAAITEGPTRRESPASPVTVATALSLFRYPAPGELPTFRRAMLARPLVTRWSMRLAARTVHQDAAALLGWLDPAAADAPGWLRRYAVLCAPGAVPASLPLPAGDSAEDDEADEDIALIAVYALLTHGSLRGLSDDWWPRLYGLADGGEPGREQETPGGRHAHEDLLTVADAAADPPEASLPAAVRVDTLRLCFNLSAAHLPRQPGTVIGRQYVAALYDLWTLPSMKLDVATLACRLIASLADGTADRLGDAAVAVLLTVVLEDRSPFGDTMAESVAGLLDVRPELIEDHRLTPQWWQRVERLRPDIRTPAARLRAAVNRALTSPASDQREQREIAGLCGDAAIAGLSDKEVASVVRPWLDRRSAPVRRAVFGIIAAILRLDEAERGRSYERYLVALATNFGLDPVDERSGIWRRRRPGQSLKRCIFPG